MLNYSTVNTMFCAGCKPHDFQDRVYGKNKRVFTLRAKGTKRACTVCGKETGSGEAPPKGKA